MGLFGRKLTYSEKTTGTIVGVSAVKVNNMHLPLAEYEVSGEKFQVRAVQIAYDPSKPGKGKVIGVL